MADGMRGQLLHAVGAILREEGVSGLSLREVARRANVSHAAPAHHFRNKAGMLTAFAAHGYAILGQTIEEEIGRANAVRGTEVLEAIGRGYVRFAIKHPDQFTMMCRSELIDPQDETYKQASDTVFGFLRSTVERCVVEGWLDAADVETAAVAGWSLVHGLADLWLGGRLKAKLKKTSADQLAAAVSKFFVDRIIASRRPRL